jgi:PPOX class probable F420-dependent enzyme
MLPEGYHNLLNAPNTAVFATLADDGSPQASPVWFLFDGVDISISTTADRLKHRNMLRDPRVTFTLFDPANPLRYIEVRGTVTLADDPDGIVRDAIATKHGYTDGKAFDKPGERRVTARINPNRIIEH